MVFTSPIQLLCRAMTHYDQSIALQQATRFSWRQGFQEGAEWMALALSELRGKKISVNRNDFQVLGFVKYGVCMFGAFIGVFLSMSIHWSLIFTSILFFYLIESLMVFLFPLAIDQLSPVFSKSVQATQKAGGVISVVLTVLPIAAHMMTGGFLGKGFLRSWAVGCLAVVIWYEELHLQKKLSYV